METQTLCSCVTNPMAMTYFMNNRIPFICKRSVKTGKMRIFFYSDAELTEQIQRNTMVHVFDERNSEDEEYFNAKLLRHGVQQRKTPCAV